MSTSARALADDLLDAAWVDAAVLDELRQREPCHLTTDRVEAADEHRLGRVVDDQVDPGGLLEGPDVAALAADDAALHLVRRDGHDRHGHLGGVVDHHALDGGHDDVARPLLGLVAGRALDGPGEANGVVLGFVPDLLEELRLWPPRGHLADPLEGGDLLGLARESSSRWTSSSCSAIEQLAVALLEHVRALVELLVPLEQSMSRGCRARRAWRAPHPRPPAAGAPAPPWPGG